MLSNFTPVSGWTVALVVISGLVVSRREIVKLILGWILVRRSRQIDIPAVARALYGAEAEPEDSSKA